MKHSILINLLLFTILIMDSAQFSYAGNHKTGFYNDAVTATKKVEKQRKAMVDFNFKKLYRTALAKLGMFKKEKQDTVYIKGKFEQDEDDKNLGTCTGPDSLCGRIIVHDDSKAKSPEAGEYSFIFPESYTGELPASAYQNEEGHMQVDNVQLKLTTINGEPTAIIGF